jgi:hypothetical protein
MKKPGRFIYFGIIDSGIWLIQSEKAALTKTVAHNSIRFAIGLRKTPSP